QEALRILPQYPLALVQLAELEARTGQYREAERHLSQVVTISASPNIYDHVVLRGIGRLKILQNDSAAANDLWDQAETRLRRDVAQGAFGHRRELAHLLLERGRPGHAEEALTLMRAEVRIRRDAETMSILAWALSVNGRLHEARDAIREALRWGVRDAGLYYRAGAIEQALGEGALAEAFFEKARATDPTFDRQARRALGVEP
ncbi:MAG: tetratricopeptide repeat protein, partial [Candidatus Methylomirabilaceae bacterium]